MAQARSRRGGGERGPDIIGAAAAEFVEKGFAAARLDDVAKRAGVSKGALYLYFDTKQAMFEAVVRQSVLPNVEGIAALVEAHDGAQADLLRAMFFRAAAFAEAGRIGAVAKMVIGESRSFPELARIWHDTVLARGIGLLTGVIARGQATGEFRAGDPRLLAVGLFAPLVIGEIWRETFTPAGAEPLDVSALVASHIEVIVAGLRT